MGTECRTYGTVYAAPGPPTPHPAGCSGARSAVLGLLGAVPGSRQQTARFQQHFSKVSQNGEVSPEISHKACHSPCSQNGLENSPLDFLRFPFSVAFSGKELMGHFDAQRVHCCQNDEVSPDVHIPCTRSGRQIPPRPRQQAVLCGRSSSGSAR